MHRPRHLSLTQRRRRPRHLLPMTEVDQVALLPAPIRPRAGLGGRVAAVFAEEVHGVAGGGEVGEEVVHDTFVSPADLARPSTGPVNARFTSAIASPTAHAMAKREPLAGGAPLALCTLAGLGIGFAWGQSTLGLLVGFGVGLLIAVSFWLYDRKR